MPPLIDFVKLPLTFALAWIGGTLFQSLGTPAPLLLGALFGVWTTGAFFRPVRKYIGVPGWVHVPIILGMGVLVGAMFTPDVLKGAVTRSSSVLAMIVGTVVASRLGIWYLTWRGFDPMLALLCALPGGQAEVMLISQQLVDKDYVVALCHLVRLAMVFCLMPILLAIVEGESGVAQSYEMLATFPSAMDLPLPTVITFATLAIAGYVLASVCRLPIPHLLGPILLSSLVHIMGFADIPRISEFVILAQLFIGGLVGSRLAQVEVKVVGLYLFDAAVNALILLTSFVLLAWLLSLFTDTDFLNLVLAFVPGGIYEVTLLTLLFGFDLGFVAFHHTVRVLLIFFSLPWVIKLFKRNST